MAETMTATETGAGRLFGEFPVPSLEEWREEVVRLLKGAPYDKKMLTPTYEGITLQPMYTPEDVKGLPFQDSLPGEWPFLRGTEPLGKRLQGWLVAQELDFADPAAYGEALRQDLERGQTAVNLVLDEASRLGQDPDQAEAGMVGRGGVSLATAADAATILEGVDASRTPVMVAGGSASVPAAALLIRALQVKGADLSQAQLGLGFDPCGNLAKAGSLPMALDQAYDELAGLTRWAAAHAPKARTLVACGHPYHEAGANAVQELAFTLASAVGTLRALEARGIPVEQAASRMQFRLSVGGHFFVEIAKLRAARVLWAQVVRACGGSDEAAKIRLHARSGRFNKTHFDPHVNMLRATTEAFSAVVGGADSLHVAPFDETLGSVSDLGRRIARNTQIMLREESKLDHVVDLAGGSWTVEALTHQVMTAAWKLFQEVEALGGLLKALETGFVQGRIAEVAAARRKALVQRTDVVVGTNQYPNALEALPEVKVPDYAALKARLGAACASRRGTAPAARSFEALLEAAASASLGQLSAALGRSEGPEVQALQVHRLVEPLEDLRKAVLAGRAGKSGPQVFLACLGPQGTYMPRLDFTRGFFQVGGFQVEDQAWFKTPEEAAQAALASGAPIVVAVGLDDTYLEAVPVLARALKAGGTRTVLVAGLLKEQADAFKAAGVDDFIHVRSDVHAVLSGLAKQMEVR